MLKSTVHALILARQWVKFMLNIKMKTAFYILPMEERTHLVKYITIDRGVAFIKLRTFILYIFLFFFSSSFFLISFLCLQASLNYNARVKKAVVNSHVRYIYQRKEGSTIVGDFEVL